LINKPTKTLLLIDGEIIDEYKSIFGMGTITLSGFNEGELVKATIYQGKIRLICYITVD
jgi:hypothetical protein